MRVYQVGGSVRDLVLGRPCSDRDWVVVGARPEKLLALGFRQVGADFPVFLHPETGEEYALARSARCAGRGQPAELWDAESVTLEEDLSRRDLTINAMAMDSGMEIVDPFGGQRDIALRCLRHVGDAFAEDPLRVLRVLRFHASFGPEWHIHADTWRLMSELVAGGMADQLPPERIWKETAKALSAGFPGMFLDGLRRLGLHLRPSFQAYQDLQPLPGELAADVGLAARFALAFGSPRHARPFQGIPAEMLRVGLLWAQAREASWLETPQADAAAVLTFLGQAGLFKEGSLFDDIVAAAKASGRNTAVLEEAAWKAFTVDTRAITGALPAGPAVGQAIREARLAAIRASCGKAQHA